MRKNLSLKAKLIGLALTLVLVPMIFGSTLFLYNLDYFKQMAVSQAEEGIIAEADESLQNLVLAFEGEAGNFVLLGEEETRKLAGSVNLSNYLRAEAGEYEMVNEYNRREVQTLVNGFISSANAAQIAIPEDGEGILEQTQEQLLSGCSPFLQGQPADTLQMHPVVPAQHNSQLELVLQEP